MENTYYIHAGTICAHKHYGMDSCTHTHTQKEPHIPFL